MSQPVSDETFWHDQRERRRLELGQPCCTQSTLSAALAAMHGNLALVVHGPADCLSSFHHHLGSGIHNVYCTRLTDHQTIVGDTNRPLADLLRLIADERGPDTVFVLGTCPIEVSGADFEPTVTAVSRETGVEMIALRTHGLELSSQGFAQDWLFATLASLETTPSRQPVREAGSGAESARRINLVAVPHPAPELHGALRGAGLEINGCYDYRAGLDAWRGICHAEASIVIDRALLPRLTGHLEECGQRIVEVPSPSGARQTEAFYRVIGEALDVEAQLEAVAAPLAAAARSQVESAADTFRGVRLGIGARMTNTARTEWIARDGLGDLDGFLELGFNVLLLVQGPPDDGARAQIEGWLTQRGLPDVRVRMFEGPWALPNIIKEEEIAICRLPDHARTRGPEAGVATIPPGAMKPFFSGIGPNIALMRRLVGRSGRP